MNRIIFFKTIFILLAVIFVFLLLFDLYLSLSYLSCYNENLNHFFGRQSYDCIEGSDSMEIAKALLIMYSFISFFVFAVIIGVHLWLRKYINEEKKRETKEENKTAGNIAYK